MTSDSLVDAVYNYGAVKNWVGQKLLPKQRGATRKNTKVGFGSFIAGGVVYVPINWKKHWILATVDMDQKQIRIYDSLGSPLGRRFDDAGIGVFGLAILRCLHDFYAERQLGRFEPDEWACDFPPCARQSNFLDCGVFMLAFIHLLAGGRSPSSNIEGGTWRKFILNCLVSGEILWPPATKKM
jgi:Ulp1 family protease